MNPAPPEKPNEDGKEIMARFSIQSSWYYVASKGWHKDGPCSGVHFKNIGPEAETMAEKRITYFCPEAWNKVTENKWKADLTQLTEVIPTDGTAHIDNYQSPGTTLLHEMTHQLFGTSAHKTRLCFILNNSHMQKEIILTFSPNRRQP